ncbi:MAG TPA: glucokinase [Anaerolineae bacterium]|nr:glucokinase [Anaerolineae bacterium]
MLLAGDIGGTKVILAIFATAADREPLVTHRYPSEKYPTLEDIVQEFLTTHAAQYRDQVEYASFGVAGPVINGQADLTNLGWHLDQATIAQTCNLPAVYLLNDLAAVATAVPGLRSDEILTLQAGTPLPTGPVAVIAPGTGLGEAFLVWDGYQYRPYPTEGGHSGFAPETDLEVALYRFMRDRYPRVSIERVCSGQAIPDLYDFIKSTDLYPEPDWLHQQIADADDPAPIISQTALEEKAAICQATMELFTAILASEAGNMVLSLNALGGVYIGGGIPPRIHPLLQQPSFLQAFYRKGRFSQLMKRIPVHVILDPQAALHGAARFGWQAQAANLTQPTPK